MADRRSLSTLSTALLSLAGLCGLVACSGGGSGGVGEDNTVPAGWGRCTDAGARFSVGYPGDWFPATGAPEPCRYFDPDRVTYVFHSESPTVALVVTPPTGSFDDTAASLDRAGSIHETVRHRSEETLGGRRVLIQEVEFTGAGLHPARARLTTYLIDGGARTLALRSFWFPHHGEDVYARYQETLRLAASTVRFL